MSSKVGQECSQFILLDLICELARSKTNLEVGHFLFQQELVFFRCHVRVVLHNRLNVRGRCLCEWERLLAWTAVRTNSLRVVLDFLSVVIQGGLFQS